MNSWKWNFGGNTILDNIIKNKTYLNINIMINILIIIKSTFFWFTHKSYCAENDQIASKFLQTVCANKIGLAFEFLQHLKTVLIM